MKKTAYYYLSLAAIVAGGLTSCQEEDMGVDYETVRASVYEKAFVSEFGTPAPDHKWGFDAASYFMGLTSPMTRTSEAHVKKQEMSINNIPVEVLYGRPADITKREHDEVAAWFKNHKVDWSNTPTYYALNGTSTQDETIVAVCQNDNYPGYGSLIKSQYNNPLGDYTYNSNILFHNGWLQHVYSNKDMYYDEPANTNKIQYCYVEPGKQILSKNGGEPFYYKLNTDASDHQYVKIDKFTGEDVETVTFNDSEIAQLRPASESINTSGHMDQLSFEFFDNGAASMTDFNDMNGGSGYGYNYNSKMNALLILDANFNRFAYHNSKDSHYHDKYICVYLEGDGYSGYYLGIDFESLGNEVQNWHPADGYCDDWIIKIGDAGVTQYEKARILCEDLGTNDFDFNDVVFDVEVSNVSGKKASVKLTLRAVGGTIPVCLCYGEHSSSTVETNAISVNGKHELHAIMGESDYTKPINVSANGGVNKNPVEINLRFGDNSGGTGVIGFPTQDFDLQKLHIYVQHSQRAEWLLVKNYDSPGAVTAPQKICVPQTVNWPTENEPIKRKYPKFQNWVANPSAKFWE